MRQNATLSEDDPEPPPALTAAQEKGLAALLAGKTVTDAAA
jgi:hypothetical protein